MPPRHAAPPHGAPAPAARRPAPPMGDRSPPRAPRNAAMPRTRPSPNLISSAAPRAALRASARRSTGAARVRSKNGAGEREMARAMGAGRGGAEGEKRNETVGPGCVCDHTACVRSCLSHTHRTPGRAAPSSKRERSRTQIYSQITTTAAEGPRARQGRQQESPPQRRSGSNEAGRDGRHHAHHAGRQQADHQQHQTRHRFVVTALVHWRGNRAIDASMGGANR